MNTVLIGNLFTLGGAIIMVSIGFLKTKHSILAMQNFQFLLMAVGNLILGGVSGTVSNFVSILRNLFCLKKEYTKEWKMFFAILQTVITFFFLSRSAFHWKELLPLLAAVLFTWFMDSSTFTLKLIICITTFFWFIYDSSLLNISGAVFDILTILSNLYGLYMLKKKEVPCH